MDRADHTPAPEYTATADHFEPLTEKIIGCGITVHRVLGPGLLESIYRECLVIELLSQNVRVQCDIPVPVTYRGQRVGTDLKLDLLVEGCVVVEVKSVAAIHPVHSAQVITYLKLTGHPVGLLMNFNTTSLRSGLKRLDHPDLYLKKQLSSSG
jgi:GxxExxY protein